MIHKTLIFEKQDDIAMITFHRPSAMNALSVELMCELKEVLEECEKDTKIGAVILTGSKKAFAAGADIKEMSEKEYVPTYLEDFITQDWEYISVCRKPIIAAVAGYALGGGCEIALMCDFILAADNAKFGQPEITIGAMPGIGGTQRMARSIGKAKTMDLCLTGRMMDAEEAERCGLVARIFPQDVLVQEAQKIAKKIASFSRPITLMNKEAVNMSFETHLQAGLKFERRQFHSIFATNDQKEGMKAFSEKRKAHFTHT